MDSSARQRSTRDRPAKPPLSQEAVVDAALTILKAEGPDAVTMRRVATELDTGPSSLYVYVAGREGLLQAMLDRVASTIELEAPDPARWRAQLHALLRRLHEAMLAHPGIASLTPVDPPTTDQVLILTENMMGILLAGGLSPQDAAWACDILILLVTATAREEDVRHPPGDRGDFRDHVDEVYRTFSALPADRFPLLSAHAAAMVAGDSTQRFGFAVDVVVDGLVARARRSPGR